MNRIVGVGVLVIGLIVLSSGLFFFVVVPGQNSTSLLSTTQYAVKKGDEISVGIPLTAGDVVKGTFAQNNGTTVNLYFMNSTEQNVFGNCAPCSSPSIFNASNPSSYNYNIKINQTGTYYVVLDNSNGNKAVSVTTTAALVNSSGMATIYYSLMGAGVVIAVVGALLAAMGGTRKKSAKDADGQKKTETKPVAPSGPSTSTTSGH